MLDTIKMKYFLKMRELEEEREKTIGSVDFQKWMSELNVSRSYEDPNGKWRAREMMSDYQWKKLGLM
jgi:hypothetical protein